MGNTRTFLAADSGESKTLWILLNDKDEIDVPIIAEGRFTSPEHARAGIDACAHAVVIGKAITNIMFNTGRFIKEAGLKKGD